MIYESDLFIAGITMAALRDITNKGQNTCQCRQRQHKTRLIYHTLLKMLMCGGTKRPLQSPKITE